MAAVASAGADESSDALAGLVALSEVSTREARSLSMSEGGMHYFSVPSLEKGVGGRSAGMLAAGGGGGAGGMMGPSGQMAPAVGGGAGMPFLPSYGGGYMYQGSMGMPNGMMADFRMRPRPRAMTYTEGDAFQLVDNYQAMRPRSSTLSDEDAVGALLSFGRRDVNLEKKTKPSDVNDRNDTNGEPSAAASRTQTSAPRERALSDMSEAALRLGKMEVVSPQADTPRSPKIQGGSGSEGGSGGGNQAVSGGSGDSASKTLSSAGQKRRRLVNIGIYSPAARRERLRRFMEKRKKRVWRKRVKYDVRKNFADSRLRFKGRFVKKEDEELMRAAMEIC